MAENRIGREKQTIEKMIELYCHDKHKSNGSLCADCQELLSYGVQRLSHCKFGEEKTVCGKCPVHCYKKDMREKMIQVMRYTGPRMLIKHPILALQHMLDGLKGPKQ